MPNNLTATAEGQRLVTCRHDSAWRRWGPYLSERQWGTVREDYSANGDAWNYFPHDHARSRAYRWGEDGLGGFAEEKLSWCLSLALWNERDPILKERLFGLTNAEGNHGEDVKELYYYLDGLPTHAYMRMLYKYPQSAFPYALLVEENRRRGLRDPELELIDSGVFDQSRYFDIFIEYAKAAPDDILMRVTVHNRGPELARVHVLPQLFARNRWTWNRGVARPYLKLDTDGSVATQHPDIQPLRLFVDRAHEFLFCENETNVRRLYGVNTNGYFKDGINNFVVSGQTTAVNPACEGSKCAAHVVFDIESGAHSILRLRLRPDGGFERAFEDFENIFDLRRSETDEFYATLQADMPDSDTKLVQRQALASMLWSKQYYRFDVRRWLDGDPTQPTPPQSRKCGRNTDWLHLNDSDILTMPDKWEYPWYAAWDLAFHCVTFALIDPEFAKSQLLLLTQPWYMHPNGQLPAYEWNFGDVNPPVQAWATWHVFQMDAALTGTPDRLFLERMFHKLALNFTWWVNRKDVEGRNVFQGGFLGLDNIGVFDRLRPLPTGEHINQADGTAWMAMYTLNLQRIAIELAYLDHAYEDMALKFFEHFLYIAEAMTKMGGDGVGLWDEQDEFYYDVLTFPDGTRLPLRVRSVVGLVPLFAVHVAESRQLDALPEFSRRSRWFIENRPDLASLVSRWEEPGEGQRLLLSLLRGHRTKCLLRRMLDENEFLSNYGVRALSKVHQNTPFVFEQDEERFEISYVPGESDSRMFGGNSNWRGPVWFPMNYLIIEALYEFHRYYGDDFKVEYPVASGQYLSLREVANTLRLRLTALFLRDPDGRRPALGASRLQQEDPHFRDYLMFHEYFHGETGSGIGAAHQTGWTGLIALLLHPRHEEECNLVLSSGPRDRQN